MGKGDKKTTKGKIYAKSHGNKRPHSTVKAAAVAKPAAKAPAKKAAVKKTAAKKPA